MDRIFYSETEIQKITLIRNMTLRNLFIQFLLLILIISNPTVSQSKIDIDETDVLPGVKYKRIINRQDTLLINILKIDLTDPDYKLACVKANDRITGRELTSSMSIRYNDSANQVIAALNTDFFHYDGEIVNNMIIDGKIVKALTINNNNFAPFKELRSQFAIALDNKFLIEKFDFDGTLILKDGTDERILKVNSSRDSIEIMIFNHYQGESTPLLQNNWVLIEYDLAILNRNNDTIYVLVQDKFKNKGNNNISKDNLILSATNDMAELIGDRINLADTLKLVLKFEPHFEGINNLTGGWPLIVKDGLNVAHLANESEGTFSNFSENKHPRTGIGFSKDSTYLFFITVDGRQEESVGVSLKEFADIMIEEDIYQGLNLDGGGSTTMVINGKVVNKPSDPTGERPVGSCLMLIKQGNEPE